MNPVVEQLRPAPTVRSQYGGQTQGRDSNAFPKLEDLDSLYRAPVLPESVVPTYRYCSVMRRRMTFAPPLETLSDLGKAAAWEYYMIGFGHGRELERAHAYREGYAQAEAEMAALQRQAVAVARSVETDYPTMARRRGDHERAQRAEQRARERGYAA